MSFYQKPVRRWPAAVITGLLALAIGIGLGYGLGRESAPTLTDQVAEAKDAATDVAEKIAVINTEYPQAVKNGRVVAQIEYDGSRSRAERAEGNVKTLESGYGQISPAQYKVALAESKALLSAVDQKRDPAQIKTLVAKIQAALSS